MIKTLLVPLAGTDEDAASLDAALVVARMFEAHIDVLHVRVDPAAVVSAMAFGDLGGGAIAGELIDQFERETAERAARARARFDAFVAKENVAIAAAPPGHGGVTAAWVEIVGDELAEIPERAALHDLVVVTRGQDRTGLPPEAIEQALMQSGKPVLIVPSGAPASPLGVVAIAWKQTPEAARAVTAAMPFLDRASQVVVLSVAEHAGGDRAAAEQGSLDAVVAQLGWHGLRVRGERVAPEGRSGADALLEAAKALGAGLLVMGGYGHTRLRELVFGGFTQRVLAQADIAVLMMH